MALSDDEKAAVREYMGYAAISAGAFFVAREPAYSSVGYTAVSLDGDNDNPTGGILSALSGYAEARIRTYFLPALRSREAEIQDAADNLDTDKAAVWTRNRDEVANRRALFTQLRRDLCAFLGYPPGSALGLAGNQGRLVRG